MPQLCLHHVVLEERAIDIIVRWIAIDEFIYEKGVERNPPVVGGRVEIVLL